MGYVRFEKLKEHVRSAELTIPYHCLITLLLIVLFQEEAASGIQLAMGQYHAVCGHNSSHLLRTSVALISLALRVK